MKICNLSELDNSFFDDSRLEELPIVKEILCAVRDKGNIVIVNNLSEAVEKASKLAETEGLHGHRISAQIRK